VADPLFTHDFSFDDAVEAFKRLADRADIMRATVTVCS